MKKSILLLLSFMTINAHALTAICNVDYVDEHKTVYITANQDPFVFNTVFFDKRFRFSSQLLSDSNKLKTYTYYFTKNKFVLLHTAEYIFNGCVNKKAIELDRNIIYALNLERALVFQCKFICQDGDVK